MKTTRFYAAITKEIEKGKLYAYVEPFTDDTNVLHLSPLGAVHINVYATKKRAREVVDFWNECYKANGTYAF